jgi:hypothetical protein
MRKNTIITGIVVAGIGVLLVMAMARMTKESIVVKEDEKKLSEKKIEKKANRTPEQKGVEEMAERYRYGKSKDGNVKDDEWKEEEKNRHMNMALEKLGEMLLEEGKDAKWNQEVEKEVQVKLKGGEYSGTTLGNVECGTTMCKIELKFDNENTRNGFSKTNFVMEGQWATSQFGGRTGEIDGETGIYFYFSREGSESLLERIKNRDKPREGVNK